jgi:stage V sporulation protein S
MSFTYKEDLIETNSGIELKVASRTEAAKAAGAIVKNLGEGRRVTLIAMGAGAVNQAVKAICIARGMAAPHGHNLATIPAFVDEMVDGVSKTAIRFIIFNR